MNIRAVLISLFLVVLFFILGIGVAIFFQGPKTPAVVPPETQTLPDSIKVLSSKIVPAITARGKVTQITGNNLTLTYQSDTATVAVRTDASVYALVPPPKTALVKTNYFSKPVTFADIKVGDNVEIGARVLANGHLEGFNVVILPPAAPVVAPK